MVYQRKRKKVILLVLSDFKTLSEECCLREASRAEKHKHSEAIDIVVILTVSPYAYVLLFILYFTYTTVT